ncbi:unnamed protein product [Plutella xylostella]|uniref:(diamondback moth) hypothetical protein n=1 Tax=Plutella xylostella TaxID=51655 RepID=A0A8S4E2L7_PLUXY|nr:unnamed protein product [Plutella xylostella]
MTENPPKNGTIEYAARVDERVIYPRNKLNGSRPSVVGGQPITEELAMELRVTAFGSSSCAPRGEWVRTPLTMRAPGQPMAYGLAAPRNGASVQLRLRLVGEYSVLLARPRPAHGVWTRRAQERGPVRYAPNITLKPYHNSIF